MAKIAFIGAGSAGFGKSFIADVLLRPALAQGTLALMEEIRFDKIHLAMYSARPGTRALADHQARLGPGTEGLQRSELGSDLEVPSNRDRYQAALVGGV